MNSWCRRIKEALYVRRVNSHYYIFGGMDKCMQAGSDQLSRGSFIQTRRSLAWMFSNSLFYACVVLHFVFLIADHVSGVTGVLTLNQTAAL